MALGIIRNSRIGRNRDGTENRVILQVEMSRNDVQTVEMFTSFGDDSTPARGIRVNVVPVSSSYKIGVGVSDGLAPECSPGEKEIYSTDDPVTTKLARLKLDKNSQVILNEGTDYAVAFEELKTAFDQLKADFDAHTHSVPGITAGPATATSLVTTPSTADIDPAKVEKVRL